MKRFFRSFVLLSIALVAAFAVAVSVTRLGQVSNGSMIDRVANAVPVSLSSAIGLRPAAPVIEGEWPPRVGQTFPDLILDNHRGDPTRLSQFAGKIILVEYAAIPCAGCQAFAGGKTRGSFGGFPVQALESIDHYAKQFAGTVLGTEDVVFVQVILYGKSVSSPTPSEVAGWAKHFGMDSSPHRVVLRGDASMLNQTTFDMIPGFHLIDRDFVLRSDSCGHQPAENLYTDLLPLLGRLARE